MDRSRMRSTLLVIVAVGTACGCDPMPKRGIALSTDSQAALGLTGNMGARAKRVTDRKANPNGRILVLEYHKLSNRSTELDRTPTRFRQDLEKLYELGYRPVTVSQWLENKMPLAPGASPVIITFDDSHPSQLRFKKDGTLDPNCFVAIWKQFAEKHPDFPVHGTFFILPPWPFGQAKHIKDKIAMLQDLGCEIGSHTWHHYNLARCSDDTVKKEIATSLDWLEKDFGITNVPLAYPYGNKPRNMEIMKGFVYNGKQYHLQCAFLAAGNPAKPLTDKDFDRWRIPRVLACEEEGGITSWLKDMKTSKKFAPYVAN